MLSARQSKGRVHALASCQLVWFYFCLTSSYFIIRLFYLAHLIDAKIKKVFICLNFEIELIHRVCVKEKHTYSMDARETEIGGITPIQDSED